MFNSITQSPNKSIFSSKPNHQKNKSDAYATVKASTQQQTIMRSTAPGSSAGIKIGTMDIKGRASR